MGLVHDGSGSGDHLLRDFARIPLRGWLVKESRTIEVASLHRVNSVPAYCRALLKKDVPAIVIIKYLESVKSHKGRDIYK
jgi:hypothetical protein